MNPQYSITSLTPVPLLKAGSWKVLKRGVLYGWIIFVFCNHASSQSFPSGIRGIFYPEFNESPLSGPVKSITLTSQTADNPSENDTVFKWETTLCTAYGKDQKILGITRYSESGEVIGDVQYLNEEKQLKKFHTGKTYYGENIVFEWDSLQRTTRERHTSSNSSYRLEYRTQYSDALLPLEKVCWQNGKKHSVIRWK